MTSNTIGRDTVFLTGSKVISLSVSLIMTLILARSTTLTEYGTYSQLLMIVNLFTTVFSLGLPNCLNYFIAQTDKIDEKRKFLNIYYTLNTLLGVIEGITLVLLRTFFAVFFENDALGHFVFFLAVCPWTIIIMNSVENLLIVFNKITWLIVYKVINSCLLLTLILTKYIIGFSFDKYIIGYIFVQVFSTIYIYFFVYKLGERLFFLLNRKILKKMLVFSIPLGISAVLGTVNIYLDQLVIGKLLDTESVALYFNAGKELPFTILSSSVVAILMPKMVTLLSKKENERAIKLWGDSVVLVYIVFCFFTCAMIVFSPQVITVLYSQKYIPATSVFRVYCLVLLLRTTYFGMILNSTGRTKFILYSSMVSLGLNIILNVLFFKLFGFIGPAIATLVSITVVNLSQLIFSALYIQKSFKSIFPWKQLAETTIENVAMAVFVSGLIRVFSLKNTIKDILIGILIGVIWMIIYFLSNLKRIKLTWESFNS